MREVESWLASTFNGNSTLVALLGKDSAGNPAIFPDVMLDPDARVPYPHLTYTRINSVGALARFEDQIDTQATMDDPRLAICAWSQTSKDEAYHVWSLADKMLRGATRVRFSNPYFSGYKIRLSLLKDNLYDRDARAYHCHAEYAMWAQLTTTAQPY